MKLPVSVILFSIVFSDHSGAFRCQCSVGDPAAEREQALGFVLTGDFHINYRKVAKDNLHAGFRKSKMIHCDLSFFGHIIKSPLSSLHVTFSNT